MVVSLVLMSTLYVVLEIMDYLPEFRTLGLPAIIAIFVGVLLVLIALYIAQTRHRVIRTVRRHCDDFTETVCPTLRLTCRLPFRQCTGIAKGWYIDVEAIMTDSTRDDHLDEIA